MNTPTLVHIDEPLLEFRFGQKLVYPRDGLFLYGPVDGGRPEVHYGAIGTPAGLARLERWTTMVADFLPTAAPQGRSADRATARRVSWLLGCIQFCVASEDRVRGRNY